MVDKNRISVLIADDEATMRNLLASVLKSCGYSNFLHASDGQQSMEHLRTGDKSLRLAFLDIDMPGFSGLEVLEMARQTRPGCAYVMVSAHSAIDNVISAMNRGAAGFVVKPYTPQKIADVLAKFEREAG
ncbi:response regulator [Duganella sp. FT92W]|uniref:Response regulator n=1 Tax=Pseudoduganella rivuli TaxID=2666085 RepID=A0A7X2LUF5_9BURK|nr:response regulator [Pseudoduganella rivuli]MRV72992.1 response regulator [Pseudoduganella rivuli]